MKEKIECNGHKDFIVLLKDKNLVKRILRYIDTTDDELYYKERIHKLGGFGSFLGIVFVQGRYAGRASYKWLKVTPPYKDYYTVDDIDFLSRENPLKF